MAGRHVVHESTRQALMRALEESVPGSGGPYVQLADKWGEPTWTATISSIVRGANDVGPERERAVRVKLGLSARELKPSEVKRAQLSKRLRAAGITWVEAMEIALSVVEGGTQ